MLQASLFCMQMGSLLCTQTDNWCQWFLHAAVQVFVNLGILLAYIAGIPYDYGVDDIEVFGCTVAWSRVVFWVASVPAVAQVRACMKWIKLCSE